MKVVQVLLLLTGVLGVWGLDVGAKAQLEEDFGYVEVRPGAHMFWVTYHVDQPGDWSTYPLIMWLQGGPGASGVGYGNFEELGPYYTNQSLREAAWTKKANVMFVDNPVGTGYSYVENFNLLTTTNQQIADDLLALLKSVFAEYPEMSSMPFFVYAESYGGKMTVDFALALDQAIKNGEIACNFHGVALGDSWISPMDSVNTWGSFLYTMGFLNEQGQVQVDQAAALTQAAVDAGDWATATNRWSFTEGVVMGATNGVNFYNVLAKDDIYVRSAAQPPHTRDLSYMRPEIRELYERHARSSHPTRDALGDLMNGAQAQRWDIPNEVVWDSQGGYVFNALNEDFMKPVIDSVVRLLEETDINVSVFTGDLDLICDTPGTYRWISNMEWSGNTAFAAAPRENLYVTEYSSQAAYLQQARGLSLFTILRSGHMVPIDVPEMSLVMIDQITEMAAKKKAAAADLIAKVQAKVHQNLRPKVEEDKSGKVTTPAQKDKVSVKITNTDAESKQLIKEEIKAEPLVKEAVKVEQPDKKDQVVDQAVEKVVKAEQPGKKDVKKAVKTPVAIAPDAAAKAAHALLSGGRPSHVTPTGEKFGKRPIIDRKLRQKVQSPGLTGAKPVVAA